MIRNPWLLAALGIVGLVMSPVLAGFAPLGGDPELMYQPIKAELARTLAEGRLPFWSDRFGLGVPLVAESHVAAFYPWNWVIYRLWDVGTAYRLALWLHSVAIAAATFAYARVLGIGPAGSALAAVGFALCGFQAVHAVHEPFYHLMPYLPLCLLPADRYAATGRLAWLAGLAVAWGAQVTLGHFQIQMWTAGLVLLAGAWRALEPSAVRRPVAGERGAYRAPYESFLASAWVADRRADAGDRLGGGDRLGATAADVGAEAGRGLRPTSGVPLQLLVPAGTLGAVRAAGRLPGPARGPGGVLVASRDNRR